MSGLTAFSMYNKQATKHRLNNSKIKKKSSFADSNGIKGSKNQPTKKTVNSPGKISKRKLKNNKKQKVLQEASRISNPILVSKKHHIMLKSKKSVSFTDSKSALISSPGTSVSSSTSSTVYHPQQVFEWIINPSKPANFLEKHWEKRALHIKRTQEDYYKQILTTEKLDTILRENILLYTRNVDVVSYVDGKRETHNVEGRAIPAALWDYYENGCSIRILNPQTYCNKLHTLLAALQEYFGCMVGVNAYLTPPGSQGFAPHYDDIEAFVLQLEGRKHWKLYAPLTKAEVLPRFSSKNFDRNELQKPIKEVTLEAGDLLYFPRGVIHEGHTDEGSHSFHITISVYQRTAYIDLMEHILKPALAAAAEDDVEFRKGLPLQYLKHIGLANADSSSEVRVEIMSKVKSLFSKMVEYISIDAAADEMGKQFIWDSMPPVPLKHEKLCMVHEDGDRMSNGKIHNRAEIHLKLKVRLLCYHCLRMTAGEETDETVRIYYSTDNAKYYHGEEKQFMIIDKALVPVVQCLLNNYPKFVEIESLPFEDEVLKMQIVSDFWEKGLLVTEQPIQ